MNFKTNLTLAAALMVSPAIKAQQTLQPQTPPQTAQKIEAPCDPKQLAEIQKREQARGRRILGGLLNRVNKEAQKKTGGAAPALTPDDLTKQVQTPCKAPAVVTPPPNPKQ
jgi:hypothetical protein